jgi:hypothetical protein
MEGIAFPRFDEASVMVERERERRGRGVYSCLIKKKYLGRHTCSS